MNETGLESPPTGGVSQALLEALRSLLRPLVRFLLSKQVTLPFLTSLLKAVYVEVATAEFPIAGRRQTDSRVSLLTGVHRKEVKRLRAELPHRDRVPRTVSIGSQLVVRWTGSPEFLDEQGRPRPLPRVSPSPSEPSFEGLVESVSKDIRPRVILDEWLRLGVAYLDDQNHVCLHANAFVPSKGFDEKAFYFGRNLRDHISAAAENLEGSKPPLFERSVYYTGLCDASVRELEELSDEVCMDALQAVNRRAAALKRRDARRQGGKNRITLGTYFFKKAIQDVLGRDKR